MSVHEYFVLGSEYEIPREHLLTLQQVGLRSHAEYSIPNVTFFSSLTRGEVAEVWHEEIEKLDFLDAATADMVRHEARCAIEAALREIPRPEAFENTAGYSRFEKQLFRWSYLENLFIRHPSIKPVWENLRRRVHSRIRLTYEPVVIQAIEQCLAEAGYPEWSPNFFKRHTSRAVRSLHTWVRTHVKSFDGRTNWSMVLERLSEKARAGFSQSPPRDVIPTDMLIPRLIETIDAIVERCDVWTPSYVMWEHQGLYERLRKTYRTPCSRPDLRHRVDTRPNWHAILLELPAPQRASFRWKFGREQRFRSEQDAVQEFVEILRQWNPERWGPSWLRENGFDALRIYWSNHFRSQHDTPDWNRLLQQLPTDLRDRFTIV